MLAALLAAAHAAAIVAVSVLPLPLWVRATACVLLLANAFLTVRRYAIVRGPQACSKLQISTDGACRLHLHSDRVLTGRLLAGWLASPLLIVAQVRCSGETLARKIVLLPDSCDAQTLRRLRIFLRFVIARSDGDK